MKIFDTLYGFMWDSMTQNNCNTYLIDGPCRVLIDPGHLQLFGHVEKGLKKINLGLSDIDLVLCTHAHPDHLEAVQLFKDLPALTAIHEEDWRLVKTMLDHYGSAFQVREDAVRPDFLLREGELSVKGLTFTIHHTPGHCPGAVCIYWPEKKALFSGDLIFKEGLGRTDLPGGNGAQLKQSIRRMANLEIEYVLPGHGGILSGSAAVKRNFQEIEQFWFAYV